MLAGEVFHLLASLHATAQRRHLFYMLPLIRLQPVYSSKASSKQIESSHMSTSGVDTLALPYYAMYLSYQQMPYQRLRSASRRGLSFSSMSLTKHVSSSVARMLVRFFQYQHT